jgi:hypothetical protein
LRLHRYPGGEILGADGSGAAAAGGSTGAGAGAGADADADADADATAAAASAQDADADARRVSDLGVEGGDDVVLAVAFRSADGGGWEAVDVTPFDETGGQQQQQQGQQGQQAAAG